MDLKLRLRNEAREQPAESCFSPPCAGVAMSPLRCQAAGGKLAMELQIKAHAYVSARDAHKVNVVPVAVELVIRS